jgi:DDE_Tnp_1-associated
MSTFSVPLSDKSRLAVLLEHFSTIDDPRDVGRITHPLAEILLLVVCAPSLIATITATSPPGARRTWISCAAINYKHGVSGGRWLTILMNRINPALFSAVFTAWVREAWPDRAEFIAIDGKTYDVVLCVGSRIAVGAGGSIKLVRAERDPEDLAREFEPILWSIRNWSLRPVVSSWFVRVL